MCPKRRVWRKTESGTPPCGVRGLGAQLWGRVRSPGRWGGSRLHGNRSTTLPASCQEGRESRLRHGPGGQQPDFGSRGPDSPVTLEIMSPELQLLRVVDEVRPRDSVVALLGTPHRSEDDFRQRGSNFKTLNNPVFTFTVTVYLCPPAVVRWVLFKINSLL